MSRTKSGAVGCVIFVIALFIVLILFILPLANPVFNLSAPLWYSNMAVIGNMLFAVGALLISKGVRKLGRSYKHRFLAVTGKIGSAAGIIALLAAIIGLVLMFQGIMGFPSLTLLTMARIMGVVMVILVGLFFALLGINFVRLRNKIRYSRLSLGTGILAVISGAIYCLLVLGVVAIVMFIPTSICTAYLFLKAKGVPEEAAKKRRNWNKILIFIGIIFVISIFLSTSLPESELEPISPRIENLSFVKGMYMASLLAPYAQSMADPARLHEDGVNTVAFPIEYPVDATGDRAPTTFVFPLNMPVYGRGEEELLASTIRKYKGENFAIFLTIKIRYLPRGTGEPLGIPESLQNDPNFYNRFNPYVLYIADIAEWNNVEYFTPLDEPEYMIGPWRGISWSQEILPKVREHYKGKVVYKSGLVLPEQIAWADFSGYDVAGTTVVVLDEYDEESYRNMVRAVIDNLKVVAGENQNVSEIWVSGFGIWEGIRTPLTENQKADIYRIVFEEALDNISGLIPWDCVPLPLKDTLAEDVVKEWFTQRIE